MTLFAALSFSLSYENYFKNEIDIELIYDTQNKFNGHVKTQPVS